tara:strand:- start:188 stop:424 length:237 start_codon:yes stop_codon:yes gene_type:complete
MMKMTKDELKAAWKSYAINFELADDVVAISEASVLLPTLIDGQSVWYQLNDEELDYINDEFYSEIEDCWHEHWFEKCH